MKITGETVLMDSVFQNTVAASFMQRKTLNAGILKAMIFFIRMDYLLRAFLPKKADS